MHDRTKYIFFYLYILYMYIIYVQVYIYIHSDLGALPSNMIFLVFLLACPWSRVRPPDQRGTHRLAVFRVVSSLLVAGWAGARLLPPLIVSRAGARSRASQWRRKEKEETTCMSLCLCVYKDGEVYFGSIGYASLCGVRHTRHTKG